MSITVCSQCGAEITGTFCRSCGAARHTNPLPNLPTGNNSRLILGVLLGITFALAGSAVAYLALQQKPSPEKAQASAAKPVAENKPKEDGGAKHYQEAQTLSDDSATKEHLEKALVELSYVLSSDQ